MCNKVFYQYSCGHSTVTVYECNKHSATQGDQACRHNSWHMTPLEEICYVCDMPGPLSSTRPPSSRTSSSSWSSSSLRASPPRPASSSSSSPPSLSHPRLGSETSSETVLVYRPKQPLDAAFDPPSATSIFSTERLSRLEELCVVYEDFRTVVRGEELVDVVPLRTRKLANARADPPSAQIARHFDMLSRAPQLVPGNT